jgi:predicted phosphodiesterase
MILIIGDPHLSKSNSLETDQLLKDILFIIDNKKIDFVVILGDIMHDHDTCKIPIMMRVHEMIEKISDRVMVYILIGNHDRVNNKVYLTDEHAFNAYKKWKNVVIVDTAKTTTWNDKKICFMPFVPDGRYMEALKDCEIDPMNFDLFFAHQEFLKCSINKLTKSKCDDWLDEYPLTISGHIHEYEMVGSNLIYVGTPFNHTYGEKGEKGLFILHPEMELEMVKLNIPKKVTKTISHEDIDSLVIDPNEKLKLIIDGPIALVKTILSNPKYMEKLDGVKIQFKDRTKKVKQNEMVFQSNKSFLMRLREGLNADNEMKPVFESIFQTNQKT